MMDRCRKHILAVLFLLCFCMGAHSQDTKVQEERKARLEREIAIIDRQLADNASKSNTKLADLNLIRKKVANRKELVAQSDRQIRGIAIVDGTENGDGIHGGFLRVFSLPSV